MKRPLWHLFIGWTLGGIVLLFLDRGSCGWWDKVWVVLFAVASYAGIAGRSGLASARVCAAAAIVSFASAIALAKEVGWAVPRFTPLAGPSVAGLFPLMVPVLLFSILSLSERVTAVIFPYSGRPGHAAWTALGFLVSVVNGSAFLAKTRIWWVWNPTGDGWPGATAVAALLASIAFGLAFVYPVDSRMRWTRWSVEVAAWLALNILFLAARFPLPFSGK